MKKTTVGECRPVGAVYRTISKAVCTSTLCACAVLAVTAFSCADDGNNIDWDNYNRAVSAGYMLFIIQSLSLCSSHHLCLFICICSSISIMCIYILISVIYSLSLYPLSSSPCSSSITLPLLRPTPISLHTEATPIATNTARPSPASFNPLSWRQQVYGAQSVITREELPDWRTYAGE